MFKKISLLSVSAICLCGLNVAFADTNSVSMNSDSGPYFGIQLGGSWTPYEFDPIHDLVYSKMDDSGFAGHANVGYAFNKYFGLEVGEQYVPKYTFTVKSYNNKPSHTRESFRKNYVDLALKATAYIGNFGLFIKPGVAWAHQSDVKVNYSDGSQDVLLSKKDQVAPLLGIGALYNINDHWSVDLSTTAYFKSKDIDGVIFAGAGLAYHV
ncbi:MAG: outer membrane beta-barrel protein [Gammaproteobacteria bacterium]|nr:outer membrane beta-barrel protein [Gammaproteobacteria bacterium]